MCCKWHVSVTKWMRRPNNTFHVSEGKLLLARELIWQIMKYKRKWTRLENLSKLAQQSFISSFSAFAILCSSTMENLGRFLIPLEAPFSFSSRKFQGSSICRSLWRQGRPKQGRVSRTTRLKSRLTRLSMFIRDNVSDVRRSWDWEGAAAAAHRWAYLYVFLTKYQGTPLPSRR